MAGLISSTSGGSATVGNKWLERFFQRRPDLHTKIGRNVEGVRIRATSSEAIQSWYARWKAVMSETKVNTNDIWNMDETGTALGASITQAVIGSSESRRTYKKASENRKWVTCIETVSATGSHTRALIICKGKNLQSTWFRAEEAADSVYTTSENGWTSNAIALRWLTELFIPGTQPGAPRLLLLDNHGSHITSEFMWTCYIRPIYLPPHTSHVLQPLDVGVFSHLKRSYRDQIESLARFEDSAPIKKIRFVTYYDQARQDALKPSHVVSAWSGAGLVPYKPGKVLKSTQVLDRPLSPTTPQTPRKRALESDEMIFSTPKTRRQLEKSHAELLRRATPSRELRTYFRKTEKAFDILHFNDAQQKQALKAQAVKLEEQETRKRPRIAIDSRQCRKKIRIQCIHNYAHSEFSSS